MEQFILSHTLGEYKQGDTFQDWPAHVTLLPWFAFNGNRPIITQQMNKLGSQTNSFEALVVDELSFGPLRVSTLEKDTGFLALHNSLRKILIDEIKPVTSFRFVGPLFNPHVTHKPYFKSPEIGETVVVKHFDLISQSLIGDNNTKQIINRINLRTRDEV